VLIVLVKEVEKWDAAAERKRKNKFFLIFLFF